MKSPRAHRPGGPGSSSASRGPERGSGQGRSGQGHSGQGASGKGHAGQGHGGQRHAGSGQAGHGGAHGSGGHGSGGQRPSGATLSLRPREGGEPRGEPRSHDQRAPGQKPYGARGQESRPQGDRIQGDRSQGERSYGDRSQGARANGPRPHGPRPNTARPAREENDFGYHGGPPQGHASDAPRGAIWLYGQHAVAAALVNPSRRLRRLLLTEEAETALAARLPRPWSIQPERTERGRIDQLLGREAVHQGIALLADPLAPPSLAAALDRPGPILVLDQVSDPRNVGAILRSAAAFGAACVIAQDRNAPEETGALAKAASGALETVPLLRAVNIARTLIALKAAGAWVVGLDAGATSSLSGPELADRRVALVLGAEGEGMRRLTRETCDMTAMLTMPGAMESLNVSAAASVALYELTRRA